MFEVALVWAVFADSLFSWAMCDRLEACLAYQ